MHKSWKENWEIWTPYLLTFRCRYAKIKGGHFIKNELLLQYANSRPNCVRIHSNISSVHD
jgi:hypothetical protein